MKKRYNHFVSTFSLLLLSGISAISCSDKDKEHPDYSRHPVVVTAQAFGYDNSTPGSTWHKGENIGVYMLEKGTGDPILPYRNVRYYANNRDDQDYFLPGSNDSVLYLPATGEAADVSAYYPYLPTADDDYIPVNVLDQNAVSISTILYARADGLHKGQRKAILSMRPVLTKLTFDFRPAGISAAELKGIKVTLRGMSVSGLFHRGTGEIRSRHVYFDIPLKSPESSANASLSTEAIVLPSGQTKDYQVVVELPVLNKQYVYEISKDFDMLNGATEYVFDSALGNDAMVVKVQSSPITDWQSGGTINGEGKETN